MWIAWLFDDKAASWSASETVGWLNIVKPISSELAPNSIDISACWTISAAAGPIKWTPKIVSVFESEITFTNHEDWSTARALPLAENGNIPTLKVLPQSLDSF